MRTYLLTEDDYAWLDKLRRTVEIYAISWGKPEGDVKDGLDGLAQVLGALDGTRAPVLSLGTSAASPRMPQVSDKARQRYVQAEPGTPPPNGVRAFVGTFLVAIDTNETDADSEPGAVDIEAVKDYLAAAVRLQLDSEECGNPVGFQSMELDYDNLRELSADEVRLYYG